MFVLKALTVVIAGWLTYLAVSRMMGQLEAARAQARVKPQRRQAPKRLRQDPRTGVYYPEE
ncbi:hypothetical protein [Aestuariivirga sp.]|uniref:hypothetical protein n=1 Tax=Aestuariivirga sp. TaxID=2650926 RepID=UPI0039E70A70